ncbi:hypothetical protein AMECASPLE_025241 [Ameca splendens]|uniref:Uncharacterized protein n=1 Tax=Ameca splendens TaxID=208324 RepID=A0ABV0ZDI0_9TELE
MNNEMLKEWECQGSQVCCLYFSAVSLWEQPQFVEGAAIVLNICNSSGPLVKLKRNTLPNIQRLSVNYSCTSSPSVVSLTSSHVFLRNLTMAFLLPSKENLLESSLVSFLDKAQLFFLYLGQKALKYHDREYLGTIIHKRFHANLETVLN